MSGVTLTYDIGPLLRLKNHIDKLKRMDNRPLANAIGSHMTDSVVKRFVDQETWEGKAFIKSAAAQARSGLTLIDSGNLRDSYSYRLDAGSNGVEIGSNLNYAAIHHFGGDTGRGGNTHIEANPVLGVSREDEREIGDMTLKHLRKAVR